MADLHSTRECVRCGSSFLIKPGPGRPKKYCTDTCRIKSAYLSKKEKVRPPCSVDGCALHSRTRGLCVKHYSRWLAHGDPEFTKHGRRVVKPCGWCGSEMVLTPSMAAKRETCSIACSNHLKNRKAGRAFRLKIIVCDGCHQQVERTVKSSNDAGRFCSIQCFSALLARVSVERNALRRIGDRRRKADAERYKAIVAPEIDALRRIARRATDPAKNITCARCGEQARRKRPFFRYCSIECQRNHLEESKRKYRRISKARRRARMRGIEHQSIDPIKVFERDRWRCHLCGVRTPRLLRGTHDDRAPELEHIVSLADGGTHTWGNVACSCRKCNREKGAESRGQLGFDIA